MKILVQNADEVSKLLPIKECIAVMREALIALAAGKVHQPLRTIVRRPDAKGVMGLMPSYMSDEDAASEIASREIASRESASGDGPRGKRAAFGLKAICVFPGNPAKGKDSHQGAVLLFSAETGELLAMMNASAITAIRTAAVSGVATDLLARAILATGDPRYLREGQLFACAIGEVVIRSRPQYSISAGSHLTHTT